MSRIPRSQTLAEINAALVQLQRDYECEPEGHDTTAERVASERLARVLRVDEVLGLMRLVKTDRVRCKGRGCGSVVHADKAAGDFCMWCASKEKNAREANQ